MWLFVSVSCTQFHECLITIRYVLRFFWKQWSKVIFNNNNISFTLSLKNHLWATWFSASKRLWLCKQHKSVAKTFQSFPFLKKRYYIKITLPIKYSMEVIFLCKETFTVHSPFWVSFMHVSIFSNGKTFWVSDFFFKIGLYKQFL